MPRSYIAGGVQTARDWGKSSYVVPTKSLKMLSF